MNIWVISGCSSGLGKCWTNSIISERNDCVIGITRSEKLAEEMKENYKNLFIPCVADIRNEKEIADKLNDIIEKVGQPNRIVTSAGYAQFGTLEDLSTEQIREQFQTNVEGTLNVIKPLLPVMRKQIKARILLVSSMSGVACWPLLGAYQITKHAIEAISDTLRLELYGTNIQVGCIEPGPHKTGWASTYARRQNISSSYDAEQLINKSKCGYEIQDVEASLPFFWKMFDSDIMPKRIATSHEFVNFAIASAQEKIENWRAPYGD